ncbi:HD domain-containing protein [Streptomyces sp. NPDC001108]
MTDSSRANGAPGAGRDDSLRERWRTALVGARGGAPGPDPAPYADNLLARWAEPQRKYHTTAHLVAVLGHIDTLVPYAADVDAVRLAAWFHDAVYRPDRSENEERSAALAERALPEAGVPDGVTAEVARLVRLTVTHDPADGDANGEVLCDSDLAVLAAGPEEYAAYAARVREEYGFVPDEAFREGRAAVLRQLLGLPRLFRTPYGAEHWEPRARRNLLTELELLNG